MDRIEIKFILNDEKRCIEVFPNETLLFVLRNKLGIKSPKLGCGRGDCGSCAVLINGKSVRSCIVLACEVDGKEVITLEGISKGEISKLQKKFIEYNSFQCGFCTPGMVITATELLNNNPTPTKDEVKEALSGNLCRCTGYEPIIEAVCDCNKEGGC